MKKILFLADAMRLSSGTMDFAAFVCKLQHCSLTGILLAGAGHNWRSSSLVHEDVIYGGIAPDDKKSEERLSLECIRQNMRQFEDACDTREVAHELKLISDHPLDRILMECRYADLLLIEPSLGLSHEGSNFLSGIVRKVLSNAECPVMVMPGHFEGLDEIVFAYDGSPSSVLAIKRFTYAFPGLSNRKLTVITANEGKPVAMVEKLKMHEWLRLYYTNVRFEEIGGESHAGLLEYVLGKEKIIVIMGAYGRRAWPGFPSASHADPLKKYTSRAIFICHR